MKYRKVMFMYREGYENHWGFEPESKYCWFVGNKKARRYENITASSFLRLINLAYKLKREKIAEFHQRNLPLGLNEIIFKTERELNFD